MRAWMSLLAPVLAGVLAGCTEPGHAGTDGAPLVTVPQPSLARDQASAVGLVRAARAAQARLVKLERELEALRSGKELRGERCVPIFHRLQSYVDQAQAALDEVEEAGAKQQDHREQHDAGEHPLVAEATS